MRDTVYDYNKLENYIKVGNDVNSLTEFPTPSSIGYLLADVDKDPFTDLKGYTHRNRVRHDVLSLELSYAILSENDLSYILNAISPVWFYVEIKDKKTQQRTTHKMYASDKQFNAFRVWQDNNLDFHEEHSDFTVTFVEE